jgi:hypothetical protein
MTNQTSTIEPHQPAHPMTPERVLRCGTEEILIPARPRYTPAEAKALLDGLRQMFAGEPSLEDEYFRDRDKDK